MSLKYKNTDVDNVRSTFAYIIKNADGKIGMRDDDVLRLVEGELRNAAVMDKEYAEYILKIALNSAKGFKEYVKKFLDKNPDNLWNKHAASNEEKLKDLATCKIVKVKIEIMEEEK